MTDGLLGGLAAGFCSSSGSSSSKFNLLRAYSSITFQSSTSKDTLLLNDPVVSSLSLSLLSILITIVMVIHPTKSLCATPETHHLLLICVAAIPNQRKDKET